MRHLVYLHGFASSPRSTKASYVARRASEAGMSCVCPDLNEPAFETLTITRMLDRVDQVVAAMPPGDVALVGSSLGALVALEAARRRVAAGARVDRLVFLAPALDLVRSLEQEFGVDGLAEWERGVVHHVFHYADQRMRGLQWSFMADARRYHPDDAQIDLPVLIYQGRRDTVVDPRGVERWASRQPRATLHLLDDDHQLVSSLDTIWAGTREFLVAGA